MTDTNTTDKILELFLNPEESQKSGAEEEDNHDHGHGPIPLVDVSMPYSDFFGRYLVKNRPSLLMDAFTSNWESRRKWTKRDQEEEQPPIDYQYLSTVYGDEKVCVTDCQKSAGGEPETIKMTVQEYLAYLKERPAHTGENSTQSQPCLYLKDWHILRCSSTDVFSVSTPYSIPPYFKSDWLNEYCSVLNIDDFRFCYIGPKGSWTGFHSDVYGSFSWSANVVGRKKWRIYFPDRIEQFAIKKEDGHVESDQRGTIQYKYDFEHPGEEGVDYFEVIQEAGQVIFVPSGWFHIVWNLEDTISINHNWFNGSNLQFVWETLRAALNDVEMELSDLKGDEEFPNLCQSLLKANHGMNYEEFMDILLFIREKRSAQSTESTESDHSYHPTTAHSQTKSRFAPNAFPGAVFGPNHIQYDLKAIEKVVIMVGADVRNREISKGLTLPSVKHKLAQFNQRGSNH